MGLFRTRKSGREDEPAEGTFPSIPPDKAMVGDEPATETGAEPQDRKHVASQRVAGLLDSALQGVLAERIIGPLEEKDAKAIEELEEELEELRAQAMSPEPPPNGDYPAA